MSKTTRVVKARHRKTRTNSFTIVALVASLSLAFAGLVATVTASSASAASTSVSADDTTDSASVDRVQKPTEQNPCDTQTPRKGLKTNTDCEQPDPCKDDKKATKSGRDGCEQPDPCKDDKKATKSGRDGCEQPDPCKDKKGVKSDSDNCGHPDPCKDQASTDSVNNGPVNCDPCKDNAVLSSSSDSSSHDRCKFYAQATFPLPPVTICVTTEEGKSNVVLPAVTGNGNGFSKVSQELADAQAADNAKIDADNQRAAQKAQYSNYTDGICVWSAEKTVTVNESICANVNGSNTTVVATGSGTASATSEISQADADQKAIDAATPIANANLAANKATYAACTTPPPPSGGDTPPPGETTTITTPPVTPVVVVEPGTVTPPTVVTPETVTPLPGTVPTAKPNKPAKKPTTVTTPQEATVPAAVPAGGGSSVPANGMPIWALSMLVIGALGAAGAGLRLVGSRTK